MKSVAVFCGSQSGNDSAFAAAARTLGVGVARRGWTLVYGGSSFGLMGALANGALSQDGKVIGVIPRALRKAEQAHGGLQELIEVDTLQARKQTMAVYADGFIALPGGFGTLDELTEMITWNQLGLHYKPVGLLNVAGFYDSLLKWIEHAGAQGLVRKGSSGLLLMESDPAALLDRLSAACELSK
ncbi:MAG: LOG family protein YvdD [Myxococcota bacterium]|nr:LOG family protein YvdD [Myxococcota bacterium]